MTISTTVKRYFKKLGVMHTEHHHSPGDCLEKTMSELGISREQLAVPRFLMGDDRRVLMAVIPVSHSLDIDRLNRLLGCRYLPMAGEDIGRLFIDAETDAYPPFGEPYKIDCIVDKHLFLQPRVFFRAGNRRTMVSIRGDDYQYTCHAVSKATISNRLPVINDADVIHGAGEQERSISDDEVRELLEKVYRLPPIPAIAHKIMTLSGDADSSQHELAAVVGSDPGFATAVSRFVSLPWCCFEGRANTLQEVIPQEPEINIIRHFAFAVASTQGFEVQRDGPFGLEAFWRHALNAGALSRAIADRIDGPTHMDSSLAWLCGLLHNFGVLVIGHLFPPEFKLLNKLAFSHPGDSLTSLEKMLIEVSRAQQFISLGHGHIGAAVLSSWAVPEQVAACCAYHHQTQYEGRYVEYVKVVKLSNYLLGRRGIGDLGTADKSEISVDYLNLDPISLENLWDQIAPDQREVNNLIKCIVSPDVDQM